MKLAVVAAVLVCVAPARADDAAAKALFDQGKALFAEGKYGEACAKLEASFKLAALSSTRGLLGACYEKVGKLASAWAAYRDSAAISERQGNKERAQAAREKAQEIEPKLAHLTIDASAAAGTPGLKVTIDKVEQPGEALGNELPIDAGPHVIEAAALDHKSWKTTIDIQDGEKQKVTVQKLAPDLTRRHLIEARMDEERALQRKRKLIAYGLGAGGLVALGVSGTFGLLANGDWNRAKQLGCSPKGECPTAGGRDLVDKAALKADIATYVGGGGLLLLGAGIVVYVTTPKPHTEAELRVMPMTGPGTAGLSLEGTF